jgi:hypothetical protein
VLGDADGSTEGADDGTEDDASLVGCVLGDGSTDGADDGTEDDFSPGAILPLAVPT